MSDRTFTPKYMQNILEKLYLGEISGKPGTVTRVTVHHDEWCTLLQGGDGCNCEPEIVYQAEGAEV